MKFNTLCVLVLGIVSVAQKVDSKVNEVVARMDSLEDSVGR